MEGAVTQVATVVAVTQAVLVAIALAMGSPAIALEEVVVSVAISVVDGTEEAVIGEDVAFTHTEHTPIPITIPITGTGIGLPGAIRMGGATGSGSHIIIEGKKN